MTTDEWNRRDNAQMVKRLAAMLNAKVSLRHIQRHCDGKDVWYLMIDGTAYSPYHEAHQLNLILSGMIHIAQAMQAKTTTENLAYWKDLNEKNPHRLI